MRDLYRCTEVELVLAVRKSMPTEKKEQEKPTE